MPPCQPGHRRALLTPHPGASGDGHGDLCLGNTRSAMLGAPTEAQKSHSGQWLVAGVGGWQWGQLCARGWETDVCWRTGDSSVPGDREQSCVGVHRAVTRQGTGDSYVLGDGEQSCAGGQETTVWRGTSDSHVPGDGGQLCVGGQGTAMCQGTGDSSVLRDKGQSYAR